MGVIIAIEPPRPFNPTLSWQDYLFELDTPEYSTARICRMLDIPLDKGTKAARIARSARFEHGEAPII